MTAPERLADLVRTRFGPALKAAGLRRHGRRVWWEGGDDRGWVLLELQSHRFNTAAEALFTVNTVVWPRGTWERARTGPHETMPYVDLRAPVWARPQDVSPHRWQLDTWWTVRDDDAADVADEVVAFLVEEALPWARARAVAEPG